MLCNCAKRFVFQTKTDVRAFIIAQRDFQGRGIDRRIPANASEKKKNYVALCSPDFRSERKNKAWFTLAVKRTVKSRSIKNLRFFSSIRTKRSYTITFSPSLLQFFFFFLWKYLIPEILILFDIFSLFRSKVSFCQVCHDIFRDRNHGLTSRCNFVQI